MHRAPRSGAHRLSHSLCLKQVAAFVLVEDLQSGTDGEAQTGDKRILEADPIHIVGGRTLDDLADALVTR